MQYKTILQRLKQAYTKRPNSFVLYSNNLELVIGTVLSAQCTDKVVNRVTRKLFTKYKTPLDYKTANMDELKTIIKSTGFYNSKAKYLQGIGQRIFDEFNGNVPNNHNDLMSLPGVSNKTANIVMSKAFGVHVGIAVDTHVRRIAPRLGWTKERKNTKIIERDLNKLIDPKDYLAANEYLILHGRAICGSKPKCAQCPIADLCPSRDSISAK